MPRGRSTLFAGRPPGIDTDVSYSGTSLDLDSVAVDNSNDPYLTFGVDDADFSVGGTAREKSSNQYQQK